MTVYTMGTWITRPEQAEEFARRWREMAEWTVQSVEGARDGVLLRDRAQSNRFVSFGPWPDLAAIEAWRANPGFQQRVAGMRELLEDFTPATLDEVTQG